MILPYYYSYSPDSGVPCYSPDSGVPCLCFVTNNLNASRPSEHLPVGVPCMVIYVSVQYNGEFLPDIIVHYSVDPMGLTLGNPFNTMKSSCPYSQCSHLSIFTFPARMKARKV